MDTAPKSVIEVECEIPDNIYNEVVLVGRDLATDQDFFNIGCRIILEDMFAGKTSDEDPKIKE